MAIQPHRRTRPRYRRWLIATAAAAVFLGAYAAALHEASLWLGADVEDALRTVPVLEADTPRGD